MKASVKLRKEEAGHENPLVRFKLPIQILGLPFMSSFTAGDSKDLSFNLHTNFLNGPSIKLSYTPTQTTTSDIHTHHHQPISLSLKSGVGLFGSPKNSPLIISAHFTHFPNPTFSLHIKPQFGDFSLSKTAVSCTSPFNSGVECNDVERPVVVMRNLCSGYEDGVFSGVGVKAKTVLPVGKKAVEVKFRWGVNFPEESFDKMRLKLPFLTVDKISIERVEKEREVVVEKKKKKKKSGIGDGEMLKGMCFWMKKEVEVLQRENNLIKESLEEMKMNGSLRRSYSRGSSNNDVSRPLGENSSEFEKRKNKKNGAEEKGRNEVKSKKFSGSDTSSGNDVVEELKRAIMAASSSGV
ncbi:hypothetical protein IFM89_027672 [Coptis chinensis]|uniref:Uncharacterized protein n=1 Tax=Coptis chinensis TaxID=261450 RepID=A0A835IVH5_9MAGN|nr:hypothetical protein IFM89_027672 [Coptis chinensis]